MQKMNDERLKNLKLNITLKKNSPLINSPLIFKKKINKVVYKPLEYLFNDMGKMRHFPPGAQE